MTHHKVIGSKMWGTGADSLRLVDEARARGIDITMDQIPTRLLKRRSLRYCPNPIRREASRKS